MSKTPVSFRVPTKLWEGFTSQANALFLNRGPFLDHMLSVELPHLQEDLKGLALSMRAKRFISGAIKKEVPLSPNVNIEVHTDTANLLRALAKEHNLVRDAFFCRLLVLLRCSDTLLEYLKVPPHASDRGLNVLLEEMPTSPMKALEAVRDNPLYYLREHVEHIHGCGLYRVALPIPTLHCYIEDEHVAGTRANARLSKLLRML